MGSPRRSSESCLDKLRRDCRSATVRILQSTSGLYNAIVNIDFICGLMFLKNIVYKTKVLSEYLQGKSINIAGALIAINSR